MSNPFKTLAIAATAAFGISSASVADVVGPVAETPLNKCIETALKAKLGDYTARRETDPKTGYYSETFQINASKLPDHMIGTRVMVLGYEGKTPESIQITGLHDGKNKETIAYLLRTNPENIYEDHKGLLIDYKRSNRDPNKWADMNQVQNDARAVQRNLRQCMTP